jgi:hypothetical protein
VQLTELAANRPLPAFALSAEAIQRRKEREAKNVVRTDQKKKYAPAIPQRKGAPPSATSAAAKRLAAKKGDQVITSAPMGEVLFDANFDAFAQSTAVQITPTMESSHFDPFAAQPAFEDADGFGSISFAESVASSSTAFDPFSSSSPVHQPSFTSTSITAVRQPSFTSTSVTAVRLPSFTASSSVSTAAPKNASSLASLFPTTEPAEEMEFDVPHDELFELPEAPEISASQSWTFAAPTTDLDGFENEFGAAFDPFSSPSKSTSVPVAAHVPTSPVRKPSFLSQFEQSPPPLPSPARPKCVQQEGMYLFIVVTAEEFLIDFVHLCFSQQTLIHLLFPTLTLDRDLTFFKTKKFQKLRPVLAVIAHVMVRVVCIALTHCHPCHLWLS